MAEAPLHARWLTAEPGDFTLRLVGRTGQVPGSRASGVLLPVRQLRPSMTRWIAGRGRVLIVLGGMLLLVFAPRPGVSQPRGSDPWVVRTDTVASPTRLATLQAARELREYLSLLRPLPRPITVRLERCGQTAEAVWLTDRAEILVCDEVVEYAMQFVDAAPGVSRYILAHELGHAVADLFGEPASGSGELEADEFAAIFLIETGVFSQDVAVAARLLERMGEIPDLIAAARAERQHRAAALRCLLRGSTIPVDAACGADYARSRLRWHRRVLISEISAP